MLIPCSTSWLAFVCIACWIILGSVHALRLHGPVWSLHETPALYAQKSNSRLVPRLSASSRCLSLSRRWKGLEISPICAPWHTLAATIRPTLRCVLTHCALFVHTARM